MNSVRSWLAWSLVLSICSRQVYHPLGTLAGRKRGAVRIWQESCLKQLEVPEMPPDRTGAEPMARRVPFGLKPQELAVRRPAAWGTGPRQKEGTGTHGDRAELKEADVSKVRQPQV